MYSYALKFCLIAHQDMDSRSNEYAVVRIGDILTHVNGVSLARSALSSIIMYRNL
jgi:hypothetical protein